MTKAKVVLPHGEDAKAKKPRLKKSDGANVTESRKAIIGQEVHGIVDGSFDAGYLLTVKVGDSPLVFRGLVFEPGMLPPLSKNNDIAPTIRAATWDQQITLPTTVEVPQVVNGSSLTARESTRVVTGQGLQNQDEGLSNLARIAAVEQGTTEPSYVPEAVVNISTLKKEAGDLGDLEADRTEPIHLDKIVDSRNDFLSTQCSSINSDVEMPELVVQKVANPRTQQSDPY
ncbi:hypothetical protein GOP47_0016097 [Adiantum capillus-veneris]|uniref:Uncharacterized protein n=1 Tax=Adiantum capillus-veneris TaxID=13818 RepID=A0A9D4ULT3_ADICA|nr:hypothetical protein GOP47_0016097 [Adiantum capillus-veneris]